MALTDDEINNMLKTHNRWADPIARELLEDLFTRVRALESEVAALRAR